METRSVVAEELRTLLPAHRGAVWWLIGLHGLVFLTFVPWTAAWPGFELDDSWCMVLHWAFLNGADFGQSLIFTYGPWGFLYHGYHPDTFVYAVLAWAFIGAVFLATLWRLSERLASRRWVKVVWIVGLVMLVGSPAHGMQDVRLFAVCWALVLLHFYVDPRPLSIHKVSLISVMALISLGKFSLTVAAVLAVLTVSVDLIRRKVVPWPLAIYLAATLVLWVTAGQNPLKIAAFLRQSVTITSGYAQGEGVDSPHEERDVALFLACAGIFIGVLFAVHWKEIEAARAGAAGARRKRLVNASLGLITKIGSAAAALFLCFKIGYVRHDGHELLATTTMAALALMYFGVLWPMAVGRRARIATIAVSVVCVALNWFSFRTWESGSYVRHVTEPLTNAPNRGLRAMRTLVGAGPQRQEHEQFLQRYREYRQLPPTAGTVDGYSWIQASLLAHALEYRPRPLFHGYLAYSPELTRPNAEFVKGDRSPQSILFELQYIDGCYTSQTDASSWPELLGRYDLKDASMGALLLERSATARPTERVALGEVRARFGEWVAVPPAAGPVWVRLRLRPTLAGRVMEATYKPPPLGLRVRTANGKTTEGRLIPGIARDGFVLSPLISDRMSFAFLWSDRWREALHGSTVLEMQLVERRSGGQSYAYDSEYELTFEQVSAPLQDISSVPGIADYLRFQQFTRSVQPMSDTPVGGMIDDDWRTVLRSPPLTRWALDVPPDARAVRVSFGMLKKSYANPASRPAVEFRLYTALPLDDGQLEATPVWARLLNPAESESDRGPQSGEIPLPIPPPPKIVLETVSDLNDGAIDAYWSQAYFSR